MRWLSRGLFEALCRFIRQAKDPSYALRAALYEFHYEPVGRAFRDALDAGADVKILYDEPSYGEENEKMIRRVGLSKVCAPRAAGGGQKHNKFIVLLKDGKPVEVWTGSTNLSAGGIFGHSNVGHVVHDPAVAGAYLAAWDALCNRTEAASPASAPLRDTRTDPGPSRLAARNDEVTPTPRGRPPAGSVTPLFSPRAPATLQWYADLLASAEQVACFTVAFTLAKEFEPFLEEDNDVLRFVLSDKQLKQGELIQRDRDVVYAAGARFEEGTPGAIVAERLTGLNNNYYIHDKFLIVDPLGDDPTVVTGSANFSGASQRTNDENMLVIRGDRRVADLYFTEFMRLFDHLYVRYVAKVLRAKEKGEGRGDADPNRGYLRTDGSWVAEHFAEGRKSRRREYFHGKWM
jgi:phosphatidylserine/phosphatidylglycerophosphate/cardiolipin synthase-like enzyme